MNAEEHLFNPELENALLGSILIDPDVLSDLPYLMSEHFHLLKNQQVFSTIKAMKARDESIDILTLSKELARVEDDNWMAYLTKLASSTPTSLHAVTYAKGVIELYQRRRLVDIARKTATLAYDMRLSIKDVALQVSEAYTGLVVPIDAVIGIDATVSSYYDDVVARSETHKIPRVLTGFSKLDGILGEGVRNGDLVIIAGVQGGGKSSLMLTMARNQARAGKGVAIASLEMTEEGLTNRLLAQTCEIDSQIIDNGRFAGDEMSAFTDAVGFISELNISFIREPFLHVDTLVDIACMLKQRGKLDVLYVDYLQLLMGTGDSRVIEVTNIAYTLKRLALKLRIPVFALSQVNREYSQRAGQRLKLSDLRESGGIESAADTVIFIQSLDEFNGVSEIEVAKQRSGPRGTLFLVFQRNFTKFIEQEVKAYKIP